jgi:hypothetical protein
MNQKNLFFLSFFSFCLLAQSCWSDKGKNIPDVSNIEVEVVIEDFNQRLFNLDTNDIRGGIGQLRQDFPIFFNLYFSQIQPFLKSPELDNYFFQNTQGFLSDPDVRKLADTTNIVFPNFEFYKKEYEQGFKFYKHYFPNNSIPKIYPLISGFNYASFIFPINEQQDGIGIGLDMLLGNDYPYWQLGIQNPAFSNYITRSFTPEHLVKKTFDALADDLVGLPQGDRLLDLMIYNGKKLYLLDCFLPYTPDSIKWEYTTQQTQWIIENEPQIWAHLLAEELIYETSTNKIKKLVDQSPSSPGMPKDAPGRTANFMGLRIIEAFMNKNPDKTGEQLLTTDAQKIMDKSKYKPRIR